MGCQSYITNLKEIVSNCTHSNNNSRISHYCVIVYGAAVSALLALNSICFACIFYAIVEN